MKHRLPAGATEAAEQRFNFREALLEVVKDDFAGANTLRGRGTMEVSDGLGGNKIQIPFTAVFYFGKPTATKGEKP